MHYPSTKQPSGGSDTVPTAPLPQSSSINPFLPRTAWWVVRIHKQIVVVAFDILPSVLREARDDGAVHSRQLRAHPEPHLGALENLPHESVAVRPLAAFFQVKKQGGRARVEDTTRKLREPNPCTSYMLSVLLLRSTVLDPLFSHTYHRWSESIASCNNSSSTDTRTGRQRKLSILLP